MMRTRLPAHVVSPASPRDSGVARQRLQLGARRSRGDRARRGAARRERRGGRRRRTSRRPRPRRREGHPPGSSTAFAAGAEGASRRTGGSTRTGASGWMMGSKILTSSPFPPRNSASSTYGLSRRSSVCGLKLSPSSATTRSPVSRMRRVASRRCDSLLRMTPLSIGTSTSAIRAMCISARRSFGQARPAEREPGSKVRGRDVEAVVLAEHAHHVPRVDVDRREEAPDLVRERDLHRVKRVARVLERFGRLDRQRVDRLLDRGERLRHELERAVVPDAGDGERRSEEVVDSASLAQELGDHADAEVVVRPATRHTLEDRTHAAVDGAGRDGAAIDDREERRAIAR